MGSHTSDQHAPARREAGATSRRAAAHAAQGTTAHGTTADRRDGPPGIAAGQPLAPPTDLAAHPLSPSCRAALAARAHACFGISPFNSYFSTERIRQLARWGLREFAEVHFFVPDVAAAATLEALGYPPDRAAHKAHRQGNHVRNRICRALADLGVDQPRRWILDAAALAGNHAHQRLLAGAQALFKGDPAFRADCLTAAGWALERRLPPGTTPSPDQLRTAVRYFLAELPLFTDTPSIVGRAASVFCYHQATDFLARLYRRELAWQPAAGQGFAVVAPAVAPVAGPRLL